MDNKKNENVIINGDSVTLKNLFQVAYQKATLELAESAKKNILKSRAFIEKQIQKAEPIYGLNTGFGAFSSVRISDDQIETLQTNLIRSHAAGVGEPFSYEQTRAMMYLRASTLAKGHSGVRLEVIDKIIEFINHDIIAVVPSQGSVGASGDLAPLAHIALALIGEGLCWSKNEHGVLVKQPVELVLKTMNIKPLVLKAKEGLSLINGCQVMTAVGLLYLSKAIDLLKIADMAGAMTLEALKGSRSAFDPLISSVRPHRGEINTASNLRLILNETSEIGLSHKSCGRVQDAYSLRCMPAVHGAVKDTIKNALNTLLIEANSSTDNPLVFADAEKILSCGNFHGMPVAFAMDFCAIALTSLGSISEQRISKLVNPSMSDGLPAFLAPQGGLNSGHMITHVVAAALTSENKVLSHPASCDSIPTSADKEDHVSMGAIAARKFGQVVNNVIYILSNELLSACQALDLLKPLKPSAPIEELYKLIRQQVPFAPVDRAFGEDTQKIYQMIDSGQMGEFLDKLIVLND